MRTGLSFKFEVSSLVSHSCSRLWLSFQGGASGQLALDLEPVMDAGESFGKLLAVTSLSAVGHSGTPGGWWEGAPAALEWWVGSCAKVFRLDFWMRHYGSPSMKPTMVVTNQRVLADLDLGPLSKHRKKTARATTKSYKDGRGKTRFSGTSRLKASQKLGL